ncbi:MAG: hypothetical protein RM022_028420 [Nostoc sp. EfeVER01]|uniref:hypothetical protein n=1 Tax=Nostoc sp. EfeVER01 TaxID=3075406 RepID=UPI00391DC4B9
MSRPQLNIKFDGEGEKELLEAVKARAQLERISLKEFVLDALKNRLRVPLSTQTSPVLTKGELGELKRRIDDNQIGLMGEIRKDRDQIATLAAAIALIESRLDVLDPPTLAVGEDSQARQSRHGWEEDCEPGNKAWDTWGSDAIEFLDTVRWGDADG